VTIVPPTTAAAAIAGTRGTGGDPGAVPEESGSGHSGSSHWLRRLSGYCWRHPTVTSLAALAAIGGVGLGALTRC